MVKLGMLIPKRIEANIRILPGDILLGLLTLDGVSKSVNAMAITSSLRDFGPNEILVLSNQNKLNIIFSQGIKSFLDLIEENYKENRFFVFKSVPQQIVLNSIPSLIEDPVTEDGSYVSFWGMETPSGVKKNAWPFSIYERTGKETIGSFVAIDIIKENGMLEMLYKIRRDGKRSEGQHEKV